MYTEESDFYDDTILNQDWFLAQIKLGRFKLYNNDSTIRDSKRNLFSTPGLKKSINKRKKRYLTYSVSVEFPVKKCRVVPLHRFVWMYYYGKIPDKHDVHHKDHNHYNNLHTNLEIISHALHTKNHCKKRHYSKTLINKLTNYSKLKNKYFTPPNKHFCTKCKRLLDKSKFKPTMLTSHLLQHCNDCLSNGVQKNKNSQFPSGVFNDYLVTDIRFKFNIMHWSPNAILKRYVSEGLTMEILKDILLGKIYTHLSIMCGKGNTAYKNSEYITKTEYNHIRVSKAQADFTVDELCMLYGRDEKTIETVLKKRYITLEKLAI